MLLYIILALASIFAAVWLGLLMTVTAEDWATAAYNKVLDNRLEVDRLRLKDAKKRAQLAQYTGVSAKVMKLFLSGNNEKKIAALERSSEQLQAGNLKNVIAFDMPGYVVLRKHPAFGKGSLFKALLVKHIELYGRKHAVNKTRQLMARMVSYPLIGVAASLAIGVIALGMGNVMGGLVVMGVGSLLVLVLTYAAYDEVSDRLNKRHDAISRQFPNVVSKLALLVTSGMIMERAWKETAFSQELELYQEMRKTADELDNLVSPEVAYSNFISRCNTKEAAKLASAIMQNLTKGNFEIGVLLKEMAREAWLERRHTAKRDAEKANSKLMIPTMMLFLAILVMLMVPVAMNLSGF